jgi:hypothetical protein
MGKSRKNRFARCLSLILIYSFLLVPFTILADNLVLLRAADETDTLYISVEQKPKLSAALKMDKNGDMVLQCVNLFSISVAHAPFSDTPGLNKLAQRTRLQVEQKGRGVFVKLAFMF